MAGILLVAGLTFAAVAGAVWSWSSIRAANRPAGQSTVASSSAGAGDAAPTAGVAVDPAKEGAASGPTENGRTSAAASGGSGVRESTFDDLKFDMPPGDAFSRSMLTEPIKQLFGSRIRIRGYILPTAHQDGIRQFVLVRDNLECCFGPGAALYDCILVELSGDRSTSYTVRPVTVEGRLNLREEIGPDGKYLVIYGLAADSVK